MCDIEQTYSISQRKHASMICIYDADDDERRSS